MITRLNPRARRDRFGSKINLAPSPARATAVPWLSVILGSLTPLLPFIASAPIVPPVGFMMLLGWRLVRPGLLPLWAGFPLGLFDDLFSGQPLGCGVLLWSLAMLGIEAVEARFPWRNFLLDWLTAGLALALYLMVSALFSGGGGGYARIVLIGPQLLLSILLFPIVARMVARLDRFRLMRVRAIG